ncbi:MAG: GNAT family N-acetyltransferase [Actinomycetota bacterium]
MALEIRPLTVDDADQLGPVHVRAWQAAYRGIMPDDYLDGLDGTARAARWREHLGDVPADVVHLVGDLEGRIVGGVTVGTERDERRIGELYAINLDPDAFGTGVGQALFEAGEEALRSLGHDEAVLWVVRENARARRFYERNGWLPDGTEKAVDFGGVDVVELRYATTL